MARATSAIKLDPNVCIRCHRCTEVCPHDAIKVGPSYIFIDWRVCDGCMKCAEACETGAISRKAGSAGAGAAAPGARSKSEGRAAPRGRTTERDSLWARLTSRFRRADSASASRTRTSPKGSGEPWTLTEASAVLAVALAAFLGKDVLLAQPALSGLRPETLVVVRVVVLGLYYAVQGVTLWLLSRARGVSLVGRLRLRAPDTPLAERAYSIAMVLGLAAAVLVVLTVYAVIAQAVGLTPEQPDVSETFGPDAVGFFLSVAMVALVAPLAEELVFRGVLLPALDERFGMWVAIVGSAVVFSLFHLSLASLVPTFVLGMACGWLAATRASLWPAIWLHGLYNLALVALTYGAAL